MRITNNMLVNDFMNNLSTSTNRLSKLQTQLSSGKKINAPSDDPSGTVKALRLHTDLAENAQYSTNVSEAMNFMNASDSSLGDINEVMQKIRELTVQAATGTNEPGSWSAISQQVNQLNEQLHLLANSQYGTKYIFSGTNVTEMPWDSNSATWTGNDEDHLVEIAKGITTPVNLKMRQFFMGKLNDLVLQSVRSGIRSITPKDLQEGHYTVNTATNLSSSVIRVV